MVEINRCHEAGCPDLCCRSPIRVFIPKDDLDKLPAGARQVSYAEIEDIILPGTYYTSMGKRNLWYVKIIFNREYCDYHIDDGCLKHEDDDRWIWCINNKFGDEYCNGFRKKYGLPEKTILPNHLVETFGKFIKKIPGLGRHKPGI